MKIAIIYAIKVEGEKFKLRTEICLRGLPCIRQLRPRYERQSKPWCPVGVLRNARCTGFSFLVAVQNATTENCSIFAVCKQKQEFLATDQ